MGGEKLPGDEAAQAGHSSTPPPTPTSILSEAVCGFITHTSPSHMLGALPSLLHDCSGKDGVGSDKVPGLIDGQSRGLDERMDEGRGGSLTQANTERQRGTTYSAMQPLTAPQQFSPPITHCQWTLRCYLFVQSVCEQLWQRVEAGGIWCPRGIDMVTPILILYTIPEI